MGPRIAEVEQRFGGLVVDLDQPRRGRRLLRCLRHHDGDVLAVMQDAVVLQRWRRPGGQRAGRARQPWRILVRDHGEHTGRHTGRRRVDAADLPGRHRRLDQRGVREVGEAEVGWVGRRTRHLERPIDPVKPGTDHRHRPRGGHDTASAAPPATADSALITVRRASSTLKALPGSGAAPSSAASAAARKVPAVAGAPRRTSSAP